MVVAEFWIKPQKEWDSTKLCLEELCPLILDVWKKKREQKTAQEFGAVKQGTGDSGEIKLAEA